MIITIQRPERNAAPQTISKMFVDGVYFSDCLEDQDKGFYQADTEQYILALKIKHETAIPYGTYEVVMSYSNRFKKYLPELLSVPGYGGIRIHSGNTKEHTSGCILPGKASKDRVINSTVITNKLISLIIKRAKVEKVFMTILAKEKSF